MGLDFRSRFIVSALLVVFAAPAAAAGPAPFMLFFDSGKPALTRDASTTLATAFHQSPANGRWLLVGHGDRSGSPAINRRMGLARATAVRARLLELGADGAMIRVLSAGEEQSIVPTADGVREPQNRRVDVRIEP